MALSIQIRGAGTGYESVTAARAADTLAKATGASNAGAWKVSGTGAELEAALADLKANQSSIASVVSSSDLELSGSQIKTYKDVILKLSAQKLTFSDAGPNLGGNIFSSLDAVYSKMNPLATMTVTGDDPSVAYSDYQTNSNDLEEYLAVGGGVAVTNFAGTTGLAALVADASVSSITVKDSIANLEANKVAINASDKIADLTGVTVSDTMANITADFAKVEASRTLTGDLLGKVGKLLIKLSANELSSAKVTATLAAITNLPGAIKDKTEIEITGSAADIIRNATGIANLGAKVTSIVGTGASIANLTALSSLKSKFTSIGITDTGINLAKDTVLASAISSWTAAKISDIKVSMLPSSADLTKITTAAGDINVSVTDTAANLNKDLALANSALASNGGKLESVTARDGTALKKAALKMSNEQYSLLKGKLAGQYTVNLSAVANVDADAAESDLKVLSFSVKDAYSSVSADLTNAGLFSNSKLSGLDITNAAVADVADIKEAYDLLSASNKLKVKTVSVLDTQSNLLVSTLGVTKLKELASAANKLVTSINVKDAAIDKITVLKNAAKVASIQILDTDANYVLASNAKLIADKKVTGFSLTGVAVSKLSGENNYLSNSKITSIGINDAASSIIAARTTVNNSKVTSIIANSATTANIETLSATTGATPFTTSNISINVSGGAGATWTAIGTYIASAAGAANKNTKVNSITFTA